MAMTKLADTINADRYLHQEINHYVSTPEQLLALRISSELDDLEHKAIYLRLCKHTRPEIIEQALSFVSDAHARHKGRLFSWKIKQLRQEWQAAGKDPRRHLPPASESPAAKSKTKRPRGQQPNLFG